MTSHDTFEISDDALASYCRRHHVRKLSLFGSVLRDDFGTNSDVDVLVDFESDVLIGFLAWAKMQREFSQLFNRPVDLVPESGLKPIIRDDVLNSARVLYAV